MRYTAEEQLSLFDMPLIPLMSEQEQIDILRMGNISRMRAKQFKAGEMIQVSFFPVWETQAEAKRAGRTKPSRAAQQRLNDQRAQDNFILYANNNFSSKDLILHLGYSDDRRPDCIEDVIRDADSLIAKMRYRHRRRNLPELRYLYCIEGSKYSIDHDQLGAKYHIHMFVSGDMDRDEIESLWNGGEFPSAKRLKPKVRRGLTGLAAYITKSKDDRKQRWSHSRNLKLPKPSIADRKVSKAQAAKIAVDPDPAKAATIAWFAKTYKGYTLDPDSLSIKRSEYVAGVYIRARLYKANDTPDRRFRREMRR